MCVNPFVYSNCNFTLFAFGLRTLACCGCGGSGKNYLRGVVSGCELESLSHHFLVWLDNGVDDRCFDDPDFEPVGVLSGGAPMDCRAFENFINLCRDYGSMTDINGLSANRACCICGGGDNLRSDVCVSDPDFIDVGGPSFGEAMNCNAFAKYSNLCRDFGSRRDSSGLTANEACCACGGKDNGIDDSCDENTEYLILQPEGFDDIKCTSFRFEGWCDLYGDWEDPNGLTANSVCCACKNQRRERHLSI